MDALPGREVIVSSDEDYPYQITFEKVILDLYFVPRRMTEIETRNLVHALQYGELPDPFDDPGYVNFKVMQQIGLS
jgi:hypothetical protein